MLNEDGSYSLDQVGIRLVRERPLYSTDPINTPKAAILLMSDLLKDMDREMLCVVNLQWRSSYGLHNHDQLVFFRGPGDL